MNRRIFGVALPLFILGVIGALLALIVLFVVIGNLGAILSFVFDAENRVDQVIDCSESAGCSFWHPIFYSAILVLLVLTGFAYTTLLERKLVAVFQNRVGPNRAGPGGFLQPVADGVKLIFKEDIMPSEANRWVYLLAPMLKAIPTLVVLAVIPLGPPLVIPWFNGEWYRVPLVLADIDVGVLWLVAITSLGTYGVVLAGWASSNKYSMLGGMRASAQMISYELSMGLAIAVPVLIVGSMSLVDIVEAQDTIPVLGWFVFQNPLAAGILIIALIAETNRAPFDLPEAEQELTAGYMTEYSGMKFALFMMAEYLGMIAVSTIAAATFFGGYHLVFVNEVPILGPLVMIGKVILFLMGFVWLRATLPRIRYDRLMTFGWKVMLPLALLAVVWTSVAVVIGDVLGPTAYAVISGLMFLVVVFGGLVFLSREDRPADDDEFELDPVITGERAGVAYGALQFVGGLLAIPFLLYEATIRFLENIAGAAGEPKSDDTDDKGALPSKSGGAD